MSWKYSFAIEYHNAIMIFGESKFSSVGGGLKPSKLLFHDVDLIIVAYGTVDLSHHISAALHVSCHDRSKLVHEHG